MSYYGLHVPEELLGTTSTAETPTLTVMLVAIIIFSASMLLKLPASVTFEMVANSAVESPRGADTAVSILMDDMERRVVSVTGVTDVTETLLVASPKILATAAI
jgi:hypothetical protein